MISEAVEAFLQVRDIPYVLGAKGDPSEILRSGRGNCTSKHLLLGSWLGELGYKDVRIGSVAFDWAQFPIPEEYLKLLKPDSKDQHSFLLVDGQAVDATWDPGMLGHGFPVLEWDGQNSTGIGVEPIGEVQVFELRYLMARVLAGGYIDLMRRVVNGLKETPFNDAVNALWGRSYRA